MTVRLGQASAKPQGRKPRGVAADAVRYGDCKCALAWRFLRTLVAVAIGGVRPSVLGG